MFQIFPFALYPSDCVGHECSKIISFVFTEFKARLLRDNGEEVWTKYHTGGTKEACVVTGSKKGKLL